MRLQNTRDSQFTLHMLLIFWLIGEIYNLLTIQRAYNKILINYFLFSLHNIIGENILGLKNSLNIEFVQPLNDYFEQYLI